MIEKCFYKDRPAIKVSGTKLTAVVLYEDGGKIASLYETATGREFLEEAKGETYKRLAYDGDFVESECSSWDDMFPTIDPFTVKIGKYKGVTYPDHGEVCRMPANVTEENGTLILTFESRMFDVSFVKTVAEAKDGGLDITYFIENKNNEPFPYLWAAHCMLKGDDEARVISSYSADDEKELAFGPEGKSVNDLPDDRLTGYCPGTGFAYKYYYTKPMTKGVFGIKYGNGQKLLFNVDEKIVKYLGVWFNNGEFKDMYNIAIECCTAPFDSPENAEAKGYKAELAANEKLEFTVHVSLEEGEN